MNSQEYLRFLKNKQAFLTYKWNRYRQLVTDIQDIKTSQLQKDLDLRDHE